MKKVLTILAVSGVVAAASAQGLINWQNAGANMIVDTNGTVYSSFSASKAGQSTGAGSIAATLGNSVANNALLGFGGYDYELLVSSTAASSPTTVAALSAWSDANLQATNSSVSNGRIVQTSTGGAGGVANNTAATANNWPAGTTEGVILVGWSANLGSTWAAALANLQAQGNLVASAAGYYFGVSAFGDLASGSANPGTTVIGANAGQINNPSGTPMVLEPLATVPEPGTMALAALGGASLLLFRRKK